MKRAFVASCGIWLMLTAGSAHHALAECGDGITTVGEACDAGGAVCQPMAMNAGSPCCSAADCTGSTPAMDLCGCTGGSCNDGVGNRDDVADACRCTCTKPICGDGVSDTGEQCDPGPSEATNGPCLGNAPNSVCGNATTGQVVNQSTFLGNGNAVVRCANDADCAVNASLTGIPQTCNANPWCHLATCGDGFVCDDPNCVSGTTPLAVALTGQTPGLAGAEACDDSNTSNADACTSFNFTATLGGVAVPDHCQANICGDGISNTAVEQCDLGFAVCTSGPRAGKICCTDTDCKVGNLGGTCSSTAGGGNGNQPNSDCRCSCQLPFCGDGISDNAQAEECDDGTIVNTPGQFCNKERRCIGGENGCDDANGDGGCGSDATENASRLAAAFCESNADCVKGTCGMLMCVQNICGDGIVGGMEQCDDGNTVLPNATNGDICGASATVAAAVNAVLKPGCSTALPENVPGACIPANCILPFCGDGVTNPGEMCDGGSCECGPSTFNPGAPCTKSSDCKNFPGATDQCGVDQGACNRDDIADRCRSTCMSPTCGDGVVDTGEACDLGSGNGDNKPCRKNALGACVLNVCGDGAVCTDARCTSGAVIDSATGAIVAATGGREQCDDANTVDPSPTNADTCFSAGHTLPRGDCVAAVCGDEVTATGEQCDIASAGCSNGNTDLSPPKMAFDCCFDGRVTDGNKAGSAPGLISVERAFTALLGCRMPNLIEAAACSAGLQRAYQRIADRVLAAQIRFEHSDVTRARRMMRSVERRLLRLSRRVARLAAPGRTCAADGTAITNQGANAWDLARGIVAHMTEDGAPFGP